MILNILIHAVDPCIEKPAFAAIRIPEQLQLTDFLLFHGEKPAPFLFLAHRWLSLTGLISPVPFDPAQHAGCIGIGSVEPQHPLFPAAGREGRGYPVNIEKNGAEAQDLLIRAGYFFYEIVLLPETELPVIAGGGILDPPYGASAVGSDILVRPELVA